MATIDHPQTDASRSRRYQQAAVLLRKWMAEDGQYDEQVGRALDEDLRADAMQCQDEDEPAA